MLLCGGSTTHETFFRDQPRYPQRIALGSTEGKVNSKQHTHLAQLLLGILTWLAKWDSSRCSCSTIHGDWTVSIHRCRVHGLKYYSRAMIMPCQTMHLHSRLPPQTDGTHDSTSHFSPLLLRLSRACTAWRIVVLQRACRIDKDAPNPFNSGVHSSVVLLTPQRRLPLPARSAFSRYLSITPYALRKLHLHSVRQITRTKLQCRRHGCLCLPACAVRGSAHRLCN